MLSVDISRNIDEIFPCATLFISYGNSYRFQDISGQNGDNT